jgi:pimeloyl-ACP methyl ester carboxylesterase/DNA-binding CsgD family transcriptional regulator
MSKEKDDIDELQRLISESPKNPSGFSDLVATWNGFFDNGTDAIKSSRIKSAAKSASIDALSDFERLPTSSVHPELGRILGTSRFPVLLTDFDGNVLSANFEALAIPGLDIGRSIDLIDAELDQGETFVKAIQTTLLATDTATPVLKQAYAQNGKHTKTVAIVPARVSRGNSALALMFFIDLNFHEEAMRLMADGSGLSQAEREVAEAFVYGRDLAEIAKDRNSSLATVRTQFQSVLQKTSTHNQAELLRKSIALSGFADTMEEIAQTVRHPHRVSADVLCRGGRKVEATLAGKPDGKVVVFLPNATQKTFQPSIEAAFAAANLCVLSICRPGTGRTDPAPKDMDIDVCAAEDVATVMSQLGAERSPFLVHSTSAPFGFRMAQLLSERVSRLVVVSGFPPAPYVAAQRTGAPFASAMIRAASSSPAMLAFLTKSGITAWRLLGTRRFMTMQLANNPDDIALAICPECLAEFDSAFQSSLARGTDAGTYELKVGTLDWSAWTKGISCEVDWLHGTKDAAVNIDAVRAFAADNPNSFALDEIDGAGWMLIYSHIDKVVEKLSLDVAQPCPQAN